MSSPQGGIFALGTASHAYLEFDTSRGRQARDVVTAIASLREPRTTMGGVNLVAGFRPGALARRCSRRRAGRPRRFQRGPGRSSTDTCSRPRSTTLSSGCPAAPTTSSSTSARNVLAALGGLASIVAETSSWPYHHDLDLTGFIDGTENPTLVDAPELVLVPEGEPGAGGTVLLLQKWAHDAPAWEALPVVGPGTNDRTHEGGQHRARGPAARFPCGEHRPGRFGKIFRRNMPYGTVTDHGTMFVGFSAEQRPLSAMLESMADSSAAPETHSRATPGRSPVRITSCRRPRRFGARPRASRLL